MNCWRKNEKNIITVILANLKAEMNKLEIIDGMIMKSMIESLEWTAEDELAARNSNNHSFSFLFRMGKEMRMIDLIAVGCPAVN